MDFGALRKKNRYPVATPAAVIWALSGLLFITGGDRASPVASAATAKSKQESSVLAKLPLLKALAAEGFARWQSLGKYPDDRKADFEFFGYGSKPNAHRDVMKEVLSLNPSQRTTLIKELRARMGDDQKIPLFLRVALLNDEASWMEIFNATAKQDVWSTPPLHDYRPLIGRMPEKVRNRILGEIGQQYYSAAKQNDSMDVRFWPKRSLDAWIRALIPGDKIFEAKYKKTKDVLASYQAYLDEMNSQLISRFPAKGEEKKIIESYYDREQRLQHRYDVKEVEVRKKYGLLDANQIIKLAEDVQALMLDRFKKTKPKDGKKPRIFLYGSVLKGLSKPGSDLDMMFDNVEPEDWGGGRNQPYRGISRYIPDDVNPSVQIARRSAKYLPSYQGKPFELNFDEVPHLFTRGLELVRRLEPFVIEVTPDHVKLLVIQPENVDKDGIVKRHDWLKEQSYEIDSVDCGRTYAKIKPRK